ncbi:hypothetical protein FDP41_002980 [Naegleria fowleri]|uniref:Uncharacterized protein n=1 Tax=Naegleria fowleri TaxID=5763 RepID=A0A6A5BUP5_NAEFO|nr:uncharacterized protein FDP41_002980 [Naegleria fowleri]KAF0977658.1 hypothetical protein FDP41_002980 [Naegleria fowleri]
MIDRLNPILSINYNGYSTIESPQNIVDSPYPYAHNFNWKQSLSQTTSRLSHYASFAILSGSMSRGNTSKRVCVYDTSVLRVQNIVAGEDFIVCLSHEGHCFITLSEDDPRFENWRSGMGLESDNPDQFQLIQKTLEDPIEQVFGHTYCVLLTRKGDVYVYTEKDGWNGKIDRNEYFDGEKIIHVGLGNEHALFVSESGKVFGYGSNSSTQLACLDRWYSELKFVRIDVSHISDKICKAYATYNTSFLLTETGALYACGDSTYAANGLTSLGSPYQCHKFTQVPISEKVEDVSPGLFFVAVKTVDNKYYVFGYNNFSQFGKTSTLYEKIDGPHLLDSFSPFSNIDRIECGGYNSIIVTKDKKVFIAGWAIDSPFYPRVSDKYNLLDLDSLLRECTRGHISLNNNTSLRATMGRYFSVIFTIPNSKFTRNFKRSHILCDISIITHSFSSPENDNQFIPSFMIDPTSFFE